MINNIRYMYMKSSMNVCVWSYCDWLLHVWQNMSFQLWLEKDLNGLEWMFKYK